MSDTEKPMSAGRAQNAIPAGIVDREAWTDLKDLDQHGENLTQWEIDFVEQLHGWLRAGRRLTEKQRETLDRIRSERL